MCGVVGWVDFARDLRAERTTLDRMTQTMAQRGPCAEGAWSATHAFLGHRRLAVIDLDGGAQPMVAGTPAGAEVVISFSGEIYNFAELQDQLRREGEVFTTRSDTEVVLRAYLRWGVELVDHLVGMFAFAIWDTATEELLLVRDRFGIKPLYYFRYPGGLLFASEPKGILANPLVRPEMEESALPALLDGRLARSHQTPFRGMHQVPPAHLVRFGRAGVRSLRYWQLRSATHEQDLDDTVATVRDLLLRTVAEQLVADVPLASLLSGGLDSTAMAAIAAQTLHATGHRLRTFSVDFDEPGRPFEPSSLRPDADGPFALLAAERLDTDHTALTIRDRDHVDGVDRARRARDLPGRGQFDTSMLALFARVRRDATVALSGEGADEVFGGYTWYHDPEALARDCFPWLHYAWPLTGLLTDSALARIRPADQLGELYRDTVAEVPRLDGETPAQARQREAVYLGLQSPLQAFLDRKDRMSMAVGLEVRVPYLDHRLVEYLWNVPWSMKVADGREKSLLRAATADLVPEEVRTRRKSAFPSSYSPDHLAAVRKATEQLLANRESRLAGLLDADRVAAVLRHEPGSGRRGRVHHLPALLEAEAWLRDYDVAIVR
ncbi:asparagine synthase (glutamine-hydrolyzing) [soil metagenome]